MKKISITSLFLFIFCFSFAQIINTIAGNGVAAYYGDGGQATAAELYLPKDVFVNNVGNIFIADQQDNVIREVNTSGIINTVVGNGYFAGTGWGGYDGDGGQATNAELYLPTNVITDSLGNIFIADHQNNRIRKVNTSGVIITIAGNGYDEGIGSGGYTGDGGQATAAELAGPTGMALDNLGNLYFVDAWNNVIRKVTTAGIITTVAGNGYGAGLNYGGYSGDGGPATAAELNYPWGLKIDHVGNMYISDCGNNRIRKVDLSGIITTVAGNGTGGYSGDGGSATTAELLYPYGTALDASGNMYVADGGNNSIRKINPLGIISTIAGDDNVGYFGDGGPATAAEFHGPDGIATDAVGNIYIADFLNYRIRKVTNTTTGISPINNCSDITIYPNPNNGQFTLVITDKLKQFLNTIEVYNMLGMKVCDATLKQVQGDNTINISNQPNGIYLYRVLSENGNLLGEGKLIIQK